MLVEMWIGLRRKMQTNAGPSTETGSGMTNNKTLALQFILYLVTCFDTWTSKLSHIGRRLVSCHEWEFFLCHQIQTCSVANPATWVYVLRHNVTRTWWRPFAVRYCYVSHVCRLILPYTHTPYLVHLLQGLGYFCFCPNYSSLLHIMSCMWALKSQGLQKIRICFSSCLLFLKFAFTFTLSEV